MNKEPIAFTICKKLHQKGYLAYYAGGYVRDLLLKIPSDDIDIATDASPDIIRSLFEKTIPLGISFGIVVVVINKISFEVATFRKDLSYKDGRRPHEIAFCSPEEDALRRDFTINGMFYDPIKKEILDYVQGQEDLKKKVISAIGNPYDRFTEDRLRMIRACRFAARFNYKIESETKQAILSKAHELFPAVSIERIYQEFQKMKNHHFEEAIRLLFDLNLLKQIFPSLEKCVKEEINNRLKSFKSMPKETPTLLYLLELFPNITTDELEELIDYLKVSNEKAKLALFCEETRRLIKNNPSKYQWVILYAHPQINLVLKIIAARLSDEKKEPFLKENEKRQILLKEHIERKKNQRPIVNSSFLMEHGIMPGKKLGELLEKAEEISIEENLLDPNDILKKLHQLPLWSL